MAADIVASRTVAFARLKEDSSISDLEEQAKKINPWVLNSILSMMAMILLMSSVAGVALGIIASLEKGSGAALSVPSIMVVAVSAAGGITCLILASDKKKRLEKKSMKNGIQASRQAAKQLGESIVPVLTKQHVDARINIDAALRSKLEERGSKWSQSDSDRIGSLLFQDLMRESVISSLILERGITSASEIESALKEMETQTAKPIQDGWL